MKKITILIVLMLTLNSCSTDSFDDTTPIVKDNVSSPQINKKFVMPPKWMQGTFQSNYYHTYTITQGTQISIDVDKPEYYTYDTYTINALTATLIKLDYHTYIIKQNDIQFAFYKMNGSNFIIKITRADGVELNYAHWFRVD